MTGDENVPPAGVLRCIVLLGCAELLFIGILCLLLLASYFFISTYLIKFAVSLISLPYAYAAKKMIPNDERSS
ncbi:hypothetical protein AB1M41_21290, partial [Bacillus inaquosorum]